MKKSKKLALTVVIIVIAAAVIIPLGMYLGGNYYFSDARIYEETWNINLPQNVKEEYSEKSSASFHGDGVRYTIFKYEDNNSGFTNDFKAEKAPEIENEVNSILAALSVAEENRPNFSNEYLWNYRESQGGDQLYIIYDTAEAKLYFVQSTM